MDIDDFAHTHTHTKKESKMPTHETSFIESTIIKGTVVSVWKWNEIKTNICCA